LDIFSLDFLKKINYLFKAFRCNLLLPFNRSDKLHICVIRLKIYMMKVKSLLSTFFCLLIVVVRSRIKFLVLIFDFWCKRISFSLRGVSLLLWLLFNFFRLWDGHPWKNCHDSWNRNRNFLLIKKSCPQILLLLFNFFKVFVTNIISSFVCAWIVVCVSVAMEHVMQLLKVSIYFQILACFKFSLSNTGCSRIHLIKVRSGINWEGRKSKTMKDKINIDFSLFKKELKNKAKMKLWITITSYA